MILRARLLEHTLVNHVWAGLDFYFSRTCFHVRFVVSYLLDPCPVSLGCVQKSCNVPTVYSITLFDPKIMGERFFESSMTFILAVYDDETSRFS